MIEKTLPLSLFDSLPDSDLTSSSGKTSKESYPQTEVWTLVPSSGRWANAGTVLRGEYLTRKTSDFRNTAPECSFSDILEPTSDVSNEYFLTPRICKSVLRSAKRRRKKLRPMLELALHEVANLTGVDSPLTQK